MGELAEKLHRATYADLEAVPPHRVAELIEGMLYTFPRPSPRHTHASSQLGARLGGPFSLGEGGPGGWRILDAPELHLGRDGEDVLLPDLAGWRLERLPRLPAEPYFTLAPDWICEVLSASTAAIDRAEKMPAFARERVRHAWLIDPIARTLEVFSLSPEGRWTLNGVHRDAAVVRIEPFEAIEINLSLLWEE